MDTINFQDIIKNNFMEAGQFGEVSMVDVAIGLLLSLLVGLFIYFIYKKSFRGVIYHHSFNITLVLMTMLTSLIIMTISTNIILSLGMVGALSIVRFRTAVKDPLDIVFMFWAIAAGIANGAGVYPVGVGGSIVIAIVVLILSRIKTKDSSFLLIIHHTEQANDIIHDTLKGIKHVLKSKTVRSDHIELVMEVKIDRNETLFVNDLSAAEGIQDVSLVSYSGDYAP
jgi:uncharacterized membrane protein YhiD involved in acid resistance